MSFRYASGIRKPGFNPLAAQTSIEVYGLYSWGTNDEGQLGLGDSGGAGTYRSSPTQIGSSSNWSTLSAYGMVRHALAVKSDGTLWAWGDGSDGQLGLGNRTDYSSPKQVGSLTTWLKAVAGYRVSFAIKTDGTLWSWGGDVQSFGVLGHGNRTAYSSPKQVGSLTNWAEVASGFRTTAAVKTDGTLWTWGNNYFGSSGLGQGTSSHYSSPKQVGSLTTWLKVACGYGHVHATTTGGALWAWGFNANGQLGLGNTTYKFDSPNQVGALTNWSSISDGTGGNRGFSLSIKTDGTLWTWGPGTSGRLGLGNTTDYSSPKQIGALTTWRFAAAGSFQSIAVKTDGTLWSWGLNSAGELGLGNTTNYSSPKQVGALATWEKITAGSQFSIAIAG